MNVLFVTSVRAPIDLALRKQRVTDWSVEVIGDQLPYPIATELLVHLGSTPLDHFHGVVLINVHAMVQMTIFAVARLLVTREYSGKLIAVAKSDDLPRCPSEARRYFRNVGIRDDQFVPTLDDAIRHLQW